MKSNRPHLDQKLSRFLVKTLKKGVPADAEFRHNSNFLFSSRIFCTKLSTLVLRLYNVLGFLQGVRYFFPYGVRPSDPNSSLRGVPRVRAFIPRYFGGIICLGQECSILVRWGCAVVRAFIPTYIFSPDHGLRVLVRWSCALDSG